MSALEQRRLPMYGPYEIDRVLHMTHEPDNAETDDELPTLVDTDEATRQRDRDETKERGEKTQRAFEERLRRKKERFIKRGLRY